MYSLSKCKIISSFTSAPFIQIQQSKFPNQLTTCSKNPNPPRQKRGFQEHTMRVLKSCVRMRRNKCGVSPRAQKPVGSSHFGHCKEIHQIQQKEKCINGGGCNPRITRDQGTWIYRGWMKNSYQVLHEKTLCNRREGVFFEQADEGEVKYCCFVRPAYC